ncbi:putative zinc binding dehydrogenase [Lasiosphaeria ovina]|uniref:Zinc binding dehydrogenase n=1 Tax=Lasiosphaeria ovina TaxID=92902 RepID=A0AAE0N4A2_9PEZI|nr:putative zinc binding dehydrogenase [Lasiosphaeria ovina]
MAARLLQTAIIQSHERRSKDEKESKKDVLPDVLPPLTISHVAEVPALSSDYDVLVGVRAVALNPTDFKMVRNFPAPGKTMGCDFCGTVVEAGAQAVHDRGTRVCGAVFPYSQADDDAESDASTGAFAQFVVADSRLLLRVPDDWDDLRGAALGGIGWATAGLAMSDQEALALPGFPSEPVPAEEREPVLVYGGATATGTVACQLLSLSGYAPIAVTSTHSAAVATEYGAAGTVAYSSPNCVQSLKTLAAAPIRHALDCITTAETVATCFAALARAGGRYACLEGVHDSWRTRRAVRVKEVMGFEGLGRAVRLGDKGSATYSRDANPVLFSLCARWTDELQKLLDAGRLKNHPIREIEGQWGGIIKGLSLLETHQVRGQKLVVKVVL